MKATLPGAEHVWRPTRQELVEMRYRLPHDHPQLPAGVMRAMAWSEVRQAPKLEGCSVVLFSTS